MRERRQSEPIILDLSNIVFPEVRSKTRFDFYYDSLLSNQSGENRKILLSLKTYYENNIRSDLIGKTTVNDFIIFYQKKDCREADGIGTKYEAIANEILKRIKDNLT
jgi:hypothetical protein